MLKKRVISNDIVTVLKAHGKHSLADVNCYCKMTSDSVTLFLRLKDITYLCKRMQHSPTIWGGVQCNGRKLEEAEVSKGAKIRNRYNQVPHLTQDTNGKVTNSQLDTTNENQEVSPFPAGDHKAHINRHAQRHSKHKTEKT